MRKLMLTLTCLTLPLAGCLESGPDTSETTAVNLTGNWAITAIEGKPVTAPSGRELRITFEEGGNFNGHNYCNNFFGKAELDLPAIKFAGVGATMMACPDLDKEQALFGALDKVDNVVAKGDGYELRSGDAPTVTLAPLAE